MRAGSRSGVRQQFADLVSRRLLYPISRRLSDRFTRLEGDGLRELENALRRNFYKPNGFLETAEGKRHLEGHVVRRLRQDRARVEPWLDRARPLDGTRILDIGCGTGSSTVALAEQGAEVTAVDIVARHMEVARLRCELHGVKVRFVEANATEIAERLQGERFDFIIFFASLEHMTHEERLIAMGNTWNMLSPGALWVVVETPNRLHFFDAHTSHLNFFNWLPHEVAFDYRGRSPRALCRDFQRGKGCASETMQLFLRLGRSISYHEFELSMAPIEELRVVSSLGTYSAGLRALRWLQRRTTSKGRYQALLSHVEPRLPPAFLEPWLNLILEKT